MQNLSCKTCGATLNEKDLDRRLAIITCSHCGGIYDLTKRQAGPGHRDEGPLEARAIAPLPSKFRVDQDHNQLRISWRWFGPKDLFLIPFTIAWNGFLFAFMGGPFGFHIFLTAHVAAGIYLTYRVLTGLLNTTTITVDSRRLTVRHYPLPWWPAPTIDVADIEQFYVAERIVRGKDSETVYFDVHAVKRDNRNVKVLRGLEEVGQALYLEQTFEQIMNIRDRRVTGEVRKEHVYL